jgi:hypothetical protein
MCPYPDNEFYPGDLSPLHGAAISHHIRCVDFLLQNNADVQQICEGKSPLEHLINNIKDETPEVESVIKTLLSHGASPNITWNTEYNRTLMLNHMIVESRFNLAHILIDHGADTEILITDQRQEISTRYYNSTPLCTAIVGLSYKGVKLLLLRGAKLYPFECNFGLNQQRDFSLPKWMIRKVMPEISEIAQFDWGQKVLATKMAKILRLAEVYREFGGSLWPNVSDTDPYTTARDMVQQFPEDVKTSFGDFPDKLEMLMTKPRSLKSFCRVAILNQMGKRFWTDVSKLHVPREVIQYLLTFPIYDNDDFDDYYDE